MSILKAIPRPTAVVLGGRTWRASEFRLGDLADLQAWIGAELPDPYAAAAWRLRHGRRDRDWKQLLSATIDAQAAYPPPIVGPAAGQLLDSAAGIRRQLALGLRREHPDFDERAAADLYPAIRLEEYEAFCRVAWALDPAELMAGMVDGPTPPGPPLDWVAAWHRYATTSGGPAPAFADLTITQFRAWMGGGNLPDGTESGRSDWIAVYARRAEFWAEIA